MGRPRRVAPSLPWLRPLDVPLPEVYRMNMIVRDPELIALLVRGVPHGQITKTMERLLREGYDRMVATGYIDPRAHLTPGEQSFIQSGQRKANKAARAAAANADAEAAGDEATAREPEAAPRIPSVFAQPAARPTAPVSVPARTASPPKAPPAPPPPAVAAAVPPATLPSEPTGPPSAPGARQIDDDDANVLLNAGG